MNSSINGPVGMRLVLLWELLQQRETTFGQLCAVADQCGVDARQVLADHFKQTALIVGTLEA